MKQKSLSFKMQIKWPGSNSWQLIWIKFKKLQFSLDKTFSPSKQVSIRVTLELASLPFDLRLCGNEQTYFLNMLSKLSKLLSGPASSH